MIGIIQDWCKRSLLFVDGRVSLAAADDEDGYRSLPATSRVFLGGVVRLWQSSDTGSRMLRRAEVGRPQRRLTWRRAAEVEEAVVGEHVEWLTTNRRC